MGTDEQRAIGACAHIIVVEIVIAVHDVYTRFGISVRFADGCSADGNVLAHHVPAYFGFAANAGFFLARGEQQTRTRYQSR